jgi:hypothetical protein
MNFQSLKQSELIQTKQKEFLEFPGHRDKTGTGPRPTAAFAGQPKWRTVCLAGTNIPLCAAHEPLRLTWLQRILGGWSVRGSALGSLASG